MDRVASQTIRSRDHHLIKSRTPDLIPQAVKSWTPQRGSTVAIISKDMLVFPLPPMGLTMISQHLSLLLNGLRLRLPLGRDAHIDRHSHGFPPLACSPERILSGKSHSIGRDTGTRDPSAAEHRPL